MMNMLSMLPVIVLILGFTVFPQNTHTTLESTTEITVQAETSPLLNFYKGVIDDIYQVDPGLNDGISILAFDLNDMENLTADEKTALIDWAGNKYEKEAFSSSFDELCNQGYIDRNRPEFEKGLLITLETSKLESDSFHFSATKWRSGLGAYFFYDCTATKSGEKWTYTIGSEMIS